ncbi:hypothetical protein KC347_g264 [Hortaea werneckii]|nr:hypothetical protein KC347_g264 [Hortaea werneckii]
MAEHNYKFNVTMTCGGCSGAIERVLKKLEGVKDFDVSLDSQTATVKTEDSVDYATVLEKIKKTGKTVNSGEADGSWCLLRGALDACSWIHGTTLRPRHVKDTSK